MFSELPLFHIEGYDREQFSTDKVSTCQLVERKGKTSTRMIQYGTSDSYSRVALRARLYTELYGVDMCLDILQKPLWCHSWSGYWNLSERTIHDRDGYVELFSFGSLRLEVKVDRLQGQVQ